MQTLTNSILSMKGRNAVVLEGTDASWRRVSHGSTRFANQPRMLQPQDGAVTPAEMQRRVASISSHMQPAFAQEPEDARLTGLTRSLYRRLTGLNVMQLTAPTRPVAAAAAAVTAAARKQARAVVPAMPNQAQVA
jgi:hypothetical protein